MGFRIACTAVVVALGWAGPADAQVRNSIAVGGGFTFRAAADPDAQGDSSVGLRWRLGHSDTGWGWHYGLGWYSTNLDRDIAGRSVRFGELKVRPIVGGYGYTHALTRRLAVTADLVGGFAFSTFEPTLEAETAFQEMTASSLDVRTSSLTPILKPEGGLWYDLGHKVGLGMSLGYTIARPGVTVISGGVREKSRLNADTLSLGVGVVYKIR